MRGSASQVYGYGAVDPPLTPARHHSGVLLIPLAYAPGALASLDCRCLELYVLTSETLVTFAVCVAGRPSRQ